MKLNEMRNGRTSTKLWIYIIQPALASCIRSFLPSNWCFLIPIQYPMLSSLHIHMHTYKYIVNINTQNPIYVFSSIDQNPNSQVGKRMSLYIICPTRKWHPSHPSIAYWFPIGPPNARRDPCHFFYSFESCLAILNKTLLNYMICSKQRKLYHKTRFSVRFSKTLYVYNI